MVSSISLTRNLKPGVMNSRVSPVHGASVPLPPASAADSSARTTVVPTATMRPPALRARAMAAHVSALTAAYSACIVCAAQLLHPHRLEGPGSDVQASRRHARHRGHSGPQLSCSIEMQARGGRRHCPWFTSKDALVALAIGTRPRRDGYRGAAGLRPNAGRTPASAAAARSATSPARCAMTLTSPPGVLICSPVAYRLAGADLGQGLVARQGALKEHLDPAPGGLEAEQRVPGSPACR